MMGEQERRASETATIANGASQSEAIDLTERGRVLLGIQTPAAWTEAGLSFLVSMDGETYVDLYDEYGEYTVACGASRFIMLPVTQWFGVRYLKLRSGTTGTPVNQGADRVLNLVTAPI